MRRCTTRREQRQLQDLARQNLWVFLNKQQMAILIEPYLIEHLPEYLVGMADESSSDDEKDF